MESPNTSALSEVDFANTTCDSDKENVTPRHSTGKAEFRCQSNLLNNTSLFEGCNESRASTSPPERSPLEQANSTTSHLNSCLNRITVQDDGNISCDRLQRERTNSCSDVSEISFDLKQDQRRFSEPMTDQYTGHMTYNSQSQQFSEPDDGSDVFTPQKPPAISLEVHRRRLAESTPDTSRATNHSAAFTPKLPTLNEHKVMGTPEVSRRHPFNDSNVENFPPFSPGIFSDTNNKTEEFKWSIEHISECNPAHFSVEQPSYILEEEKKDVEDPAYQSHVKSYFSQSRIAPSPMMGSKSFIPGAGGYSTVECQTDISLPKEFDLEALLEPLLGKGIRKTSPKAQAKIPSDTSYMRQLFPHEELADGGPYQADPLVSPEELQHSPTIKSAPGTPLSDASPSFLIGDPGNISNIGFSPIKSATPRDDNALFRTPGPSSRKQLSDSYNTPAHLSVNSEERMLMSTPAPSDNQSQHNKPSDNQSQHNKRKPDHTPEKSGHNFKKYANSPFLSPIGRAGNTRRHKNCPVKKARVETEGSPGPRRHVTFSAPAPRRPMESSRIDSDVSSEGVSPPNFAPGIQALDIPLDISEIKHPDLTKLRTNNFLDISDLSRKSTPCTSPALSHKMEWDSAKKDWSLNEKNTCTSGNNETNSDSNKPTNSTTKDSGFSSTNSCSSTLNTNHTLAAHTATLSVLSENPLSEGVSEGVSEGELESRPGKRKQDVGPEDISTGSDDSGFCPPPVKRVLSALDGANVEIRDPGSSP